METLLALQDALELAVEAAGTYSGRVWDASARETHRSLALACSHWGWSRENYTTTADSSGMQQSIHASIYPGLHSVMM